MRNNLREANRSQKWLLLILPPLVFLLKDMIATIAVLSNEPGVTPRAVMYYRIAQLPGRLFFGADGATLFNILVGIVIGWLLYRRATR